MEVGRGAEMVFALDEHGGIHEGLSDDDEAVVEKDVDQMVTEAILILFVLGSIFELLEPSNWGLGRTLPTPQCSTFWL